MHIWYHWLRLSGVGGFGEIPVMHVVGPQSDGNIWFHQPRHEGLQWTTTIELGYAGTIHHLNEGVGIEDRKPS